METPKICWIFDSTFDMLVIANDISRFSKDMVNKIKNKIYVEIKWIFFNFFEPLFLNLQVWRQKIFHFRWPSKEIMKLAFFRLSELLRPLLRQRVCYAYFSVGTNTFSFVWNVFAVGLRLFNLLVNSC